MNTIQQRTLSALVAAVCFAGAAHASAPMAKTPAPGYSRIMLGQFEITPLSDGTVDLPVQDLLAQDVKKSTKTLTEAHLKLPVETSDNAYLVNTGSKLILIDSGAGSFFGPTLGKLVANMKAAGYQPEQVDEIYITHFHGDHVGGLVNNSAAVFPKAVVRANKLESDYWLSKANMDKSKDKDSFKGAQAALGPYVKAGRFKAFEGDVELVPGIRAQAAIAHTPGHTTYLVESGGQKLHVIGDLIHVAAVQMENPDVTIQFDNDQKAAPAARKKVFDAAAKGGYMIGGAHLQFPGMGYLRTEGKGYRYIPVNYTQMR
ncbi:MBL fold metallo-hydrolase [Massilia sp. IC2-477]|uniref:MBL fold metallo-hydrolase n=1 Tax=Massilia sp. IC2-477 TaxID=2887198 RepID=UPI001D0F9EC5|nr:MBL fold metallo-hydrolase [Massilia sp. IC2-477]MCC2956493.1 MBL fold metallo-hydrolase [Massilia sp. IC2-477]